MARPGHIRVNTDPKWVLTTQISRGTMYILIYRVFFLVVGLKSVLY